MKLGFLSFAVNKNYEIQKKYAPKISFRSNQPIQDEFITKPSLARIRHGEFGKIRSASELTDKDVAKALNSQLEAISEQDIENVIQKFTPQDKGLALKTLQKMSQWGNLESLYGIDDALVKLKVEGSSIKAPDEVNLGTTLCYLNKKDSSKKSVGIEVMRKPERLNEKVKTLASNDIVILDDAILQKLESDPKFLAEVKKTEGIKLAYPDGWINGNNLFSDSSVEAIYNRTKIVANHAKSLQQEKGLSEDAAIAEAMNYNVIKRLAKLGLEENLSIVKSPKLDTINPTAKDIERMFAPKRIDEAKMEKILKKIPKKYKQEALELIARESHVYSPKKLQMLAKQQYSQILKMAKEKGIMPENIYYFAPISDKSYGITAMQYQIANNIPLKNVITNLNSIKKLQNIMVVVLDDVAGSGNSLKCDYGIIRRTLGAVEIAFVPTVSTTKAKEVFRIIETNDHGHKLTYMPSEIIQCLKDTEFYKSLDENKQALVYAVSGGSSHGRNDLNIAFPYMAPDNNNSLFGALIAPEFLLGGISASKNSTWRAKDVSNFLKEK